MYYLINEGLFSYYINIETGEKKFTLDQGDILVERDLDDFMEGDTNGKYYT